MRNTSRGFLLAVVTALAVATMACAVGTWTKTYGSGLDSFGHDVLLLENGECLVVYDTVM